MVIGLVDDHHLLREALSKLIKDFEFCESVICFSDGTEVVEYFKKNNGNLDVIILDLNMPRMDGYETAEWLNKNHPNLRILILTMYDSDVALIRLLKLGVKGFLKKDIHPEELQTALKAVMAEEYFYTSSTTGKIVSFFMKNGNTSMDRAMLSPIEIDFLNQAASDLTYKEIAEKLKMNVRTIDNIRDALFEKLDVKSRVGLALYAVKNGIVTF